jgi:hypothetical protein
VSDERIPALLDRAAALIEARGWRSGGYGRPAPAQRDSAPLDVTNAIRVAVDEIEPPPGGGELLHEALVAFQSIVAPLDARQGRGVSRWNDRQREAAVVQRELRRAAAVLRGTPQDVPPL